MEEKMARLSLDANASIDKAMNSQETSTAAGVPTQSSPDMSLGIYGWDTSSQYTELYSTDQYLGQSLAPTIFGERYTITITFFNRTPTDPTGSCSPVLIAYGNTKLQDIFDRYVSKTYPSNGDVLNHDPRTREDFCFMSVNLSSRRLGKKFYYKQAKANNLIALDTDWGFERRVWLAKVMLVSSDRMPKGDYRPHDARGPNLST